MRIPWIMYVGAGAHALPLIAVAIKRPSLGPARRWVLLWCAFLVTASALTLLLALTGQNNHWMHYVVTPVAAALVLWALAYWQQSPLAALAIRLVIPLLVAAWVPIALALEDPQTFSLFSEPFVGLLVTATAVYTLAARSLHETQNLAQQDWFWVSVGVAAYHGAAVALQPTAYLLWARHPQLVGRAYQLNAVIEIVAFLLVARGITGKPSMLQAGGLPSLGRLRAPRGGPRPGSEPLPRRWDW